MNDPVEVVWGTCPVCGRGVMGPEGVACDDCDPPAPGPMWRVLDDVVREREAQNAKCGEQNHPDHPVAGVYPHLVEWRTLVSLLESTARESMKAGPVTWAAILAEEVGEALQEDDPVKLRAELVQVAAVACAWVEAIDRRTSGSAS